MKKFILSIFSVALLTGMVNAQTPPDQIVRENMERLIGLIKTNREAYIKDNQKLYSMVQELAKPYFDFRVMAKSVLARHWREATEEQRARFTHEFRDLLVRTYSTALLLYNDEEIQYLPLNMQPGDKTAVVRTEVVQKGGGPNIRINYNFYQQESGWKLYDVSIQGVSLVTNYRSAYGAQIQKEGLDALIKSLTEGNQQGDIDKTAPGPQALKSK